MRRSEQWGNARKAIRQWIAEKLIVWCARQLPYTVKTEREWVIIRSTFPYGHNVDRERLLGEIHEFPRDVLESWGVDCSPIDRGQTLWIDRELSIRIHNHRLCEVQK